MIMDNSQMQAPVPSQPQPQIIVVPSPVPPENNRRTNVISISSAIVIAAIFIAGAIYFSSNARGGGGTSKSTIEQLGIDKARFADCVSSNRYRDVVQKDIDSAARAMAHITDGFGTPYSIAVSRNGAMVEIPGALPYEEIRQIVNGLLTDRMQGTIEMNLDPVNERDHVLGDHKTAGVTIIEYGDLDCSFCSRFHSTMEDIMKTYDGDVAWVYRHLPLESIHPTARAKAEASECVAELGGNKAFWTYISKLLELKRPTQETFDAEAF